MDTTPLWFLGLCAGCLWSGLAISYIVSRRRLRREDATQKGQNK